MVRESSGVTAAAARDAVATGPMGGINKPLRVHPKQEASVVRADSFWEGEKSHDTLK